MNNFFIQTLQRLTSICLYTFVYICCFGALFYSACLLCLVSLSIPFSLSSGLLIAFAHTCWCLFRFFDAFVTPLYLWYFFQIRSCFLWKKYMKYLRRCFSRKTWKLEKCIFHDSSWRLDVHTKITKNISKITKEYYKFFSMWSLENTNIQGRKIKSSNLLLPNDKKDLFL